MQSTCTPACSGQDRDAGKVNLVLGVSPAVALPACLFGGHNVDLVVRHSFLEGLRHAWVDPVLPQPLLQVGLDHVIPGASKQVHQLCAQPGQQLEVLPRLVLQISRDRSMCKMLPVIDPQGRQSGGF